MLSPYRDFTPEETRRYERQLEDFYRGFVAKVADQRRMSPANVDSVAQGRVWTGLAARERGLVDELGGFDAALAAVREKAGLSSDEPLDVEPLPRPHVSLVENLFDALFADEGGGAAERIDFPRALRALTAAARFPAGATLAHLPFTITIR